MAANSVGRHTQELEEAWIVQALVREDGLAQTEVAELLGRHKSWVCRRLATCDFVRRHDSVLLIGQSGKSRIVQSIGRQACVLGYRVRYATSGTLLGILNAALADKTLERTVAQLARLDLLIIDEFGFDRLERTEAQQAVSLLYKLIDARSQRQSTILVSNIDFDAWGDYLGERPCTPAPPR